MRQVPLRPGILQALLILNVKRCTITNQLKRPIPAAPSAHSWMLRNGIVRADQLKQGRALLYFKDVSAARFWRCLSVTKSAFNRLGAVLNV